MNKRLTAAMCVLGLATQACKSNMDKAREQLAGGGYALAAEGLVEAARKNDTSALALFPIAGVSLAAKDAQGDTALCVASEMGNAQAVGLLLKDAQVKVDAPCGVSTPLARAVLAGRDETAQALLAAGANPLSPHSQGAVLLRQAVLRKNTKLAATLLEKGVDPNDKPMGGEVPLVEAARAGDLALVKMLLQHKADPSVKVGSRTIADEAAHTGHAEVARYLEELGIALNYSPESVVTYCDLNAERWQDLQDNQRERDVSCPSSTYASGIQCTNAFYNRTMQIESRHEARISRFREKARKHLGRDVQLSDCCKVLPSRYKVMWGRCHPVR